MSRLIVSVSDARLGLRLQHHVGVGQLPLVARGWALWVSAIPAAPNYRQQWHPTASGLLAEIMRGPTPGVGAPVRVSGFCLQTTSDRTRRSSNSSAFAAAATESQPNRPHLLLRHFSFFVLLCRRNKYHKGSCNSSCHGACCVYAVASKLSNP